jgi:hypothetical protein
MNEEEFRRKNGRRLDLIRKEYDEGYLSAAESAEMVMLREEVFAELERRYPRDLEGLGRRLDQIEERLKGNRNAQA